MKQNSKDVSAKKAPETKVSKREVRSKKIGKKPAFFERIQQFKEYLLLSRLELRKVSWPSQKETRTTSLVVFGFVFVMALLLGLVDLALTGIVRLILS